MALTFINDLNQTPQALVVLSDSLSSLSTIQQDKKSSREDLIKEIVVVIHQLITRGTAVTTKTIKQYLSDPRTNISLKIFPLENFVKKKHCFRRSGTRKVHEELKITKLSTSLHFSN